MQISAVIAVPLDLSTSTQGNYYSFRLSFAGFEPFFKLINLAYKTRISIEGIDIDYIKIFVALGFQKNMSKFEGILGIHL